jgi:uncharacterized protein
MNYAAPWWLPGGNLQTIWASKVARRFDAEVPLFRRERWTTPDADFIDVDWGVAPTLPHFVSSLPPEGAGEGCTLLVLFHGLEGSSASHYSQSFAAFARSRGMAFCVPHFRGCSGELNLAPRAYHSGDFEEIGWILKRLRQQHTGPIVVAGVSLGGNALLRWAEEEGDEASKTVSAVASVCSPVDLTASGLAIGRGFNRLVYTRMFINSMKPKAMLKLAQHPGLFDGDALSQASDLYAFDNIFTAPLHGFKNTDDYWARGSAKPHLHRIRIPALVVNALNDPFIPAASLPQPHQVGKHVTLWHPRRVGMSVSPKGDFRRTCWPCLIWWVAGCSPRAESPSAC